MSGYIKLDCGHVVDGGMEDETCDECIENSEGPIYDISEVYSNGTRKRRLVLELPKMDKYIIAYILHGSEKMDKPSRVRPWENWPQTKEEALRDEWELEMHAE